MDKILEKIIAEDEDIAKAHRKFGEFTEDEKLKGFGASDTAKKIAASMVKRGFRRNK